MKQWLHFVVGGILSASLGLAGGCGKGTPLGPTPPPPPPGPIGSALLITGWVGHTTFQPCRDCTVEVLDGPDAGRSVLTDANGGFTLSIADRSETTLRASKDGYRPATQVASPNGQARAVFVLESVHPPLDLGGTYSMTIEADIHCERLPAEIRRRNYVVSLSPRAERLQTLFGAQPLQGRFDEFLMFWGVSGNEVGMLAPGGDNEGPGIIERLENGTIELRLAAGPQMMTTATSMRIAAAGQFSHCTGNSVPGCTVCDGPSHLLTMTRR